MPLIVSLRIETIDAVTLPQRFVDRLRAPLPASLPWPPSYQVKADTPASSSNPYRLPTRLSTRWAGPAGMTIPRAFPASTTAKSTTARCRRQPRMAFPFLDKGLVVAAPIASKVNASRSNLLPLEAQKSSTSAKHHLRVQTATKARSTSGCVERQGRLFGKLSKLPRHVQFYRLCGLDRVLPGKVLGECPASNDFPSGFQFGFTHERSPFSAKELATLDYA